MSARVVILVPRRAGIRDRDALWAFTKPWWQEQFPDWPIHEGHHNDGPFNRSAAVNAAARVAGDWDVAILIDSDVLTDPEQVKRAVPQAVKTGQMVVPFVTRYNLSPRGTLAVLGGDQSNWMKYVARKYRDQHSSVLAIPRTLYDDIGGFDEGFRGWGMEDTAWALACEVFAGRRLERLEGEVWHLHHEATPGEKHGTATHRRNMARLSYYEEAHKTNDREAIRKLTLEGQGVELPTVLAESIPRILHRVVPEQTNATAEEWWERWGRLHPGWQLMTHRDPLHAVDWPLTARRWQHVSCGAQLADLIRLEALIRWGGVYVDQDMEPFRPLDPLLGAQVFAAWEDDKVVPNAVLGARPDHPLIKAVLEDALRSMRKSVWEAGPGATTRQLVGKPGVLLLPPGSFYDVHYRDPDRDTKMLQPPGPWTFARHHYWGSWLAKERQRVPA